MAETQDYDKSATPTSHAVSHQDGGTDEIYVEGLRGALAEHQPSRWGILANIPALFPNHAKPDTPDPLGGPPTTLSR